MKFQRMVADFGNSKSQFMIDGHEFEMPSAVHEVSEEEAMGLFAEGGVSANVLHKNIAISIENEDGVKKYYRVGEFAKKYALSTSHITRLNDKTKSETVLVMWAGAIALYHAMRYPEIDDIDSLQIRFMETMLPIWTVKQAAKFSVKLAEMANRFKQPVTIELLTEGYRRTIRVKVDVSRTDIEGEIARFAMKYDVNTLQPHAMADQFQNAVFIMNDLGGQTQDLAKLGQGFDRPQSREDFKSETDDPFLKKLESLRTDKLQTYFDSLTDFEKFILDNSRSRSFIYRDLIEGEETDLTSIIDPSLQSLAKVHFEKALRAFPVSQDEDVYYVHIGGVNQLLEPYTKEYINQRFKVEAAKARHIFPKESRKLNLYGAEIVAKNEVFKLDGKINGDVRDKEQQPTTAS